MHCDDAARAVHAGGASPDLEIHLSACDECRALAEDLAELRGAFSRARAAWGPSPGFRVRLPAAPWRRMAIAACLLVMPLVAWAAASIRAPRAAYDVGSFLEPAAALDRPTDPELLGKWFLQENPQ